MVILLLQLLGIHERSEEAQLIPCVSGFHISPEDSQIELLYGCTVTIHKAYFVCSLWDDHCRTRSCSRSVSSSPARTDARSSLFQPADPAWLLALFWLIILLSRLKWSKMQAMNFSSVRRFRINRHVSFFLSLERQPWVLISRRIRKRTFRRHAWQFCMPTVILLLFA